MTLEEFDRFAKVVLDSHEVQWSDDDAYDSVRDVFSKVRERLYAEELNEQAEKALLKKLLAKYGELK